MQSPSWDHKDQGALVLDASTVPPLMAPSPGLGCPGVALTLGHSPLPDPPALASLLTATRGVFLSPQIRGGGIPL